MTNTAWLVLGDQLFPKPYYPNDRATLAFMAEDEGLCTVTRNHQHKLVLFLSAMRHFAEDLRARGLQVHYTALPEAEFFCDYETKLAAFIAREAVSQLHAYEIEDKFFAARIQAFCQSHDVSLTIHPNPMFLTSRSEFADYLNSVKKPFMKTFYERQRRRLGILMDTNGKPRGGKYSFDSENRKKLPKGMEIPGCPNKQWDAHDRDVVALVGQYFANHPGEAATFWLPTRRSEALRWLDHWLDTKSQHFGSYQDALSDRDPFLFHSLLTPALNLGMILPSEVLERLDAHAARQPLPLNAHEGFVRQLIGWREFVRGIYQRFSEQQDHANFWNHQRRFAPSWERVTTGIPILDQVLRKVERFGYAHHIERLMVLSNLMLLCEIQPQEVHRWFMERFVDSAHWVMGPNVYGMGLFADGGIFSTKPYICGSNYLRKMSGEPKGDWCDVVDGLYWRFVAKQRHFFDTQPRMSMMVRMLDKMDSERRARLIERAEQWLVLHTRE